MNERTSRWQQRNVNYRKALNRLADIVNLSAKRELDEYERDSIVKRFDFTFECAWRVMKSYAEHQGLTDVGASRDSIRRAFQLHLIDNAEIWMEMIKWRNETSHNYDGEVADSVIDLIKNTLYPLMLLFSQKMDSLSNNEPQYLFE